MMYSEIKHNWLLELEKQDGEFREIAIATLLKETFKNKDKQTQKIRILRKDLKPKAVESYFKNILRDATDEEKERYIELKEKQLDIEYSKLHELLLNIDILRDLQEGEL